MLKLPIELLFDLSLYWLNFKPSMLVPNSSVVKSSQSTSGNGGGARGAAPRADAARGVRGCRAVGATSCGQSCSSQYACCNQQMNIKTATSLSKA
eukprot:6422203-Amphidinium_carterae.1